MSQKPLQPTTNLTNPNVSPSSHVHTQQTVLPVTRWGYSYLPIYIMLLPILFLGYSFVIDHWEKQSPYQGFLLIVFFVLIIALSMTYGVYRYFYQNVEELQGKQKNDMKHQVQKQMRQPIQASNANQINYNPRNEYTRIVTDQTAMKEGIKLANEQNRC